MAMHVPFVAALVGATARPRYARWHGNAAFRLVGHARRDHVGTYARDMHSARYSAYHASNITIWTVHGHRKSPLLSLLAPRSGQLHEFADGHLPPRLCVQTLQQRLCAEIHGWCTIQYVFSSGPALWRPHTCSSSSPSCVCRNAIPALISSMLITPSLSRSSTLSLSPILASTTSSSRSIRDKIPLTCDQQLPSPTRDTIHIHTTNVPGYSNAWQPPPPPLHTWYPPAAFRL